MNGTLTDCFARGVEHHRRGHFDAAINLYEQVLRAEPAHTEAMHRLGLAWHQRGDQQSAIHWLRKAVAGRPENPHCHAHLAAACLAGQLPADALQHAGQAIRLDAGLPTAYLIRVQALYDLGRFEECAATVRATLDPAVSGDASGGRGATFTDSQRRRLSQLQAAALVETGQFAESLEVCRQAASPGSGSAAFDRIAAVCLTQLGRRDEAITAGQSCLLAAPDDLATRYNLANALRESGRYSEAVSHYEIVLRQRPEFVEAANNLAISLRALDRDADAEAVLRDALRIAHNSALLHETLGGQLADRGEDAAAITHLDAAIVADPHRTTARFNRALVRQRMGELESAASDLRVVLQAEPDHVEALKLHGNILHEMGHSAEALTYYDHALSLQPDHAGCHHNRAMTLLLQGDFDRGWREYEWRWKLPQVSRPLSHLPRWEGKCLTGRTLLLMSEQGLGDTLQFIRFAAPLADRGARVWLFAPSPLVALLQNVRGVQRIVTPDESDDWQSEVDFTAPLMSLPRLLETTPATIPADVPYLAAESRRVPQWSQFLESAPGFHVGICWQGNPDFPNDSQRSIPLRCFTPLADIPGVQLISLQKGHGSEQLAELGERMNILEPGPALDANGGAFVDTAAIMQQLDLVITSDTAIAHLAGGLGVPVWLALAHVPEWRWMIDRDDSPWYPTMRLFRQTRRGDWDGVFARIAGKLTELSRATGKDAP